MPRLCDPGAKPPPPGNFPYGYGLAIWPQKLGFSHALPTAHTVWLNTQNNAWFGSKISIICCELSGAPTPRTSHQGLCQFTLLGNFRPPDPLCPIPPNSGYATGVQVFIEAMAKVQTACKGTARRHVVQMDCATLRRAEEPRDVTRYRETARCHVVQRPCDVTSCRGTVRRYSVQRNRATPRGAEGPRDATACRETARCHVVQRDRATLQRAQKPRERCHVVQRDRATSRRAEGPHDAKARRGTARRHEVQRNRAMPRGAERPRNVTSCRRTARRYVLPRHRGLHVAQRDRATVQRAEKSCDATWCRETARRHVVQRDCSTTRFAEGPRTSRRAEGPLDAKCCGETARCHVVQRPRDATACRGKSCKLKSFCDRDVDRSTTRPFGPASGEPDAPCPSRRTLDAG